MSEERIENITKSDSNFVPIFVDCRILPDISFNGHYIRNNIYITKIYCITKASLICISYKLHPWLRNLNADFALNNCIFRSLDMKLIKNTDPDK